jgi:hypothetical protein
MDNKWYKNLDLFYFVLCTGLLGMGLSKGMSEKDYLEFMICFLNLIGWYVALTVQE